MAKEAYEAALDDARAALEEASAQPRQQIANYPAPISGCDAQFNQLLSDRARISRAIDALKAVPFMPTPRMLEPAAFLESR
ncbi:MAG: hypothetical protein AAF253_07050 [Pseudomonadota bacterium]